MFLWPPVYRREIPAALSVGDRTLSESRYAIAYFSVSPDHVITLPLPTDAKSPITAAFDVNGMIVNKLTIIMIESSTLTDFFNIFFMLDLPPN